MIETSGSRSLRGAEALSGPWGRLAPGAHGSDGGLVEKEVVQQNWPVDELAHRSSFFSGASLASGPDTMKWVWYPGPCSETIVFGGELVVIFADVCGGEFSPHGSGE